MEPPQEARPPANPLSPCEVRASILPVPARPARGKESNRLDSSRHQSRCKRRSLARFDRLPRRESSGRLRHGDDVRQCRCERVDADSVQSRQSLARRLRTRSARRSRCGARARRARALADNVDGAPDVRARRSHRSRPIRHVERNRAGDLPRADGARNRTHRARLCRCGETFERLRLRRRRSRILRRPASGSDVESCHQ